MNMIDWDKVTSCVATAEGPQISYGDEQVGVGQYYRAAPRTNLYTGSSFTLPINDTPRTRTRYQIVLNGRFLVLDQVVEAGHNIRIFLQITRLDPNVSLMRALVDNRVPSDFYPVLILPGQGTTVTKMPA